MSGIESCHIFRIWRVFSEENRDRANTDQTAPLLNSFRFSLDYRCLKFQPSPKSSLKLAGVPFCIYRHKRVALARFQTNVFPAGKTLV